MSWDDIYIHDDSVGDLEGTIIKGRQFMIQVEEHPCVKREGSLANGRWVISIWSEDDETWFKKTSFASYWLPELKELLEQIPKD